MPRIRSAQRPVRKARPRLASASRAVQGNEAEGGEDPDSREGEAGVEGKEAEHADHLTMRAMESRGANSRRSVSGRNTDLNPESRGVVPMNTSQSVFLASVCNLGRSR